LPSIERLADARAQRRDERLDFVVAQDFVQPGALGVENLAAQRQDGLEVAVAPLLGRAAGRVALDDVKLAARRVALGAVGQLAGQGQAFQRALAHHQVAGRLAGRVAGARAGQAAVDDALGLARDSPPGSWPSASPSTAETSPATSAFISFTLVWLSNCGSGCLTLTTASPLRACRR
jgi:hypothetical protein